MCPIPPPPPPHTHKWDISIASSTASRHSSPFWCFCATGKGKTNARREKKQQQQHCICKMGSLIRREKPTAPLSAGAVCLASLIRCRTFDQFFSYFFLICRIDNKPSTHPMVCRRFVLLHHRRLKKTLQEMRPRKNFFFGYLRITMLLRVFYFPFSGALKATGDFQVPACGRIVANFSSSSSLQRTAYLSAMCERTGKNKGAASQDTRMTTLTTSSAVGFAHNCIKWEEKTNKQTNKQRVGGNKKKHDKTNMGTQKIQGKKKEKRNPLSEKVDNVGKKQQQAGN